MKFKVPGNQKKEIYIAAFITFVGNCLGMGMMAAEQKAAQTDYLERNKYGEGAYEETLKVRTGDRKQEIQILVEEQKYTSEDVKTYLNKAEKELSIWMEKESGQTGKISHNLKLPESLEQNPALLSWSTDRPEVLRWDGTLGENLQSTGEKVNLICTLTLGEEEKIWKKEVLVYPPQLSSEQKFQKEIQEQAEKSSEDSSEKLYLPRTFHGKDLHYEKKGSNAGGILCMGSIILGMGIFPLQKEKEKQKAEKRKKQMQMDYPEMVEKLVLFLRAGFSIRKAIEKLAQGYVRNKEKYHMKERAAYEELVKTCLEMEGGVYEAEAYERMGKRCGLSQYKILSVLLVQNLQKGNQSILELLEREAASAGEERKRNARVKGEEASTKLLLPMVMQLIVVLIILMVPAFLSFM